MQQVVIVEEDKLDVKQAIEKFDLTEEANKEYNLAIAAGLSPEDLENIIGKEEEYYVN